MPTELEREMYFMKLRERCRKRDESIARLNEEFPFYIEENDLVAEIPDIPEIKEYFNDYD